MDHEIAGLLKREPLKPSINMVPGLTYYESEKLKQFGAATTNKLLKRASSHKGRREFAEKTAIPTGRLLEIANMADLLRVKGLGTDYVLLLREAGVSTLKELSIKNPVSFHKKLCEINRVKGIVLLVPSLGHIERFIEDAKKLDLTISY